MNGKMTLGVSQLNEYIKMLLDGNELLSDVYVKGEISNFTNHRTGHFYFSLKDEAGLVRAVMFRSYVSKLRFIPEDGMKVTVHGRVSSFVRDGQYQLYVDDMQPDGIGSLYIAFEQLKKKLEAEGLFDQLRKRPIPKLPYKIGIVTSPTGAAIRDMINVTGRRWPAAKILLCPALVQGVDAPESLCRSIALLNAYNACDVIIIGRGGGSIEDLWAFNDERVVRALAASGIPTISAVGHETDFTLCDFVADCRAPTPSAAAELAVPDRVEYMQRVADMTDRLASRTARIVGEKRNLLLMSEKRLELCSPAARLASDRQTLSYKSELLESLISQICKNNRDRLAATAQALSLINPLSVLGRGYSVTKDASGRIVSSVNELDLGGEISIVLSDGEARAKVTEIKSN